MRAPAGRDRRRPTATVGLAPGRTEPWPWPTDAGLTPVGTCRRLQALMNRAWSPAAIEAATGIPAAQVGRALADPASVSPLLAYQVAAAYDALWNKKPPVRTPGERQAAHAAQQLALANDWAPPAAWDDDQIDQARGEPAPGWKRTLQNHRAADMAEDVAFLRETGYRQAPPAVLAMRLGLPRETLERALLRDAHRTREAAREREAGIDRQAEMESDADRELEAG